MPPEDAHPATVVAKLASRVALGAADIEAILAVPLEMRRWNRAAYLTREGAPPGRYCRLVGSGLALRHKLTVAGGRQIVSLHVPGDFLDFQQLFLAAADCNIQALTPMSTVDIDCAALRELVLQHPNIGSALWIDALIEAAISREWTVNIGRRDARARIVHLLCEFVVRMRAAGIPENNGYELPMTQEQIGDAIGITSVHVNRVLRMLAAEGLIRRERRSLICGDLDAMRSAGEFNPLYLHVSPAAAPREGSGLDVGQST
jgi:CRP-like cAMP-binding protein